MPPRANILWLELSDNFKVREKKGVVTSDMLYSVSIDPCHEPAGQIPICSQNSVSTKATELPLSDRVRAGAKPEPPQMVAEKIG